MSTNQQNINQPQDLGALTNIDVVAKNNGQCLVAYETPFAQSDMPEWAEFDAASNILNLFAQDGSCKTLGRELKSNVSKKLYDATEAVLMCMSGGRIHQNITIPLIVQNREGA